GALRPGRRREDGERVRAANREIAKVRTGSRPRRAETGDPSARDDRADPHARRREEEKRAHRTQDSGDRTTPLVPRSGREGEGAPLGHRLRPFGTRTATPTGPPGPAR